MSGTLAACVAVGALVACEPASQQAIATKSTALTSGFTGSTYLDRYLGVSKQADGRVTATSWVRAATYDPQTNLWTAHADNPNPLAFSCQVTLASGKILRAGGSNGSTGSVVFDPVAAVWTATGTLRQARTRASCAPLADGRAIITGGLQFGLGINSSEIFDPATNQWTLTGNANAGHTDASGVLLADGRVLLLGGAMEVFNPVGNQFTLVPSGGFWELGTRLSDGRVLLLAAGSAAVFNPTNLTVSAVAAPPTMRSMVSATLLSSGRVAVIGGTAASGADSLATIELYDPALDSWTTQPPLLQVREGHASVELTPGFVLVIGGTYRQGSSSFAIPVTQGAEVIVANCAATTCAQGGYTCGTAPDGCGGTLQCGICSGGLSCVGNQCTSCTPATCASLGYTCGTASDGCAGTLDCGSCGNGLWCSANVCVATPVDQVAAYDSVRRVPACLSAGRSCDTGTLVRGRGPLGPEPNAPNTLGATCADGTAGTFHSDESLDSLKVRSADGGFLQPGAVAIVDATVWAFTSGGSDVLDIYAAPNADVPNWTLVGSVPLTASGQQTRTLTFTLPTGALQAIRGQFRYGSSASACQAGSYNDRDDLVINTSPPDFTPPQVAWLAPSPGAVLRGSGLLTATASDASGIASVAFFDGAALLGTDLVAPYELSWDVSFAAQGPHLLRAVATDTFGNAAEGEVAVDVDNSPTVALLAPATGATVEGDLTLSASPAAAGIRGISIVEFLIDGTVVGAAQAEPWSLVYDTRQLANGPHVVVARATDTQGLAATSTGVTVQFDNDVTAPIVTLDAPAEGELVRGTVSVRGTATDERAVTHLDVRVDGTLLAEPGSTPFDIPWATAGLSDGPHSLSFCASDAAQNQGCVTRQVVVDNTAPTVVLTSPASAIFAQGPLTITATATDTSGVAEVQFLVDGVVVGAATQLPYQITWPATEGTHLVSAWGVDAAGNGSASQSVSVTIATARTASYSSTLRVPLCGSASTSCSTGALVRGRGPLGPEPNASNTLGATCTDGSSGTFHGSGESIDAVEIASVDGQPLVPGRLVAVTATVWAVSTDDRVDLWYAANANSPSWVRFATLTPPVRNNTSVVSAQFTLPTGGLQAVRASLRRGGSAVMCPSGTRNDRDDLAFVTQ